MLEINQDMRSVALFGVISALVIWLLSSFSVFDSWNIDLYELSSPVFLDAPETQVVGLVIDQQLLGNELEFSKLITKLQKFSPGRLLLLTDGVGLPASFDPSTAKFEVVPLLQYSSGYTGEKHLSLNSQFRQPAPAHVAIPSPTQKGVLRSVSLTYEDPEGQSFNSFLKGFDSRGSNESELLINFDRMPVYIPEITGEQVLQDKIIKQLVSSKTVLMGSGYIANQAVIDSPRIDDDIGISVLQAQALSLQAVLSQAYLRPPSTWVTFVVVSLNFAVILIAMRSLSSSTTLLMLSIMIGTVSILIVVASHLFVRVLPYSEYLLSSLIAYGLYIHVLQDRMSSNQKRMVGDMKTQLSTIVQSQSFNTTAKPWLEIANLVSQYMVFNKSVLLRKVLGFHRVKEAHTINCSVDDILEKRRDYKQTPYSTALKENGPIGTGRHYFKELDDDEIEFITPLTYGGKLFGFWVLTIKADDGWNRERFLFNVQLFSEQIGYLLHQRESSKGEGGELVSLWQRGLGLFAHKRDNALQSNVHSALNHLSVYQSIFNSMHSAVIIYDLFGGVVEINQSMEKIVGRCEINVFNVNALEFVSAITGIDANEARGKLRYVVVAQKKTTFTTTFELDNHNYMVSVAPVIADDSLSAGVNKEDYPFNVIGLLVEFIDVESVKHVVMTARGVNLQYLNTMKDNLSVMQLQLLREEQGRGGDSDTADTFHASLKEQLSLASYQTKTADRMINDFVNETGSAGEPIDIVTVYQTSIRDSQAAIKTRRVSVEEDFPKILSPVVGNVDVLQAILKLVFDILLEDALPNTTINVVGRHRYVNDKPTFHMWFSNSGFGIPQHHVQQSHDAESGSNDVSSNLVLLNDQLSVIEGWGAKGRVSSKLGKGFRISLIFRGVLFSE